MSRQRGRGRRGGGKETPSTGDIMREFPEVGEKRVACNGQKCIMTGIHMIQGERGVGVRWGGRQPGHKSLTGHANDGWLILMVMWRLKAYQ